jgi:hypothetical protein
MFNSTPTYTRIAMLVATALCFTAPAAWAQSPYPLPHWQSVNLIYDNHTDRIVIVTLSMQGQSQVWVFEIPPGRSPVPSANLQYTRPGQTYCLLAHYRNPPTDAVKLNGSDSLCWGWTPGSSIRDVISLGP